MGSSSQTPPRSRRRLPFPAAIGTLAAERMLPPGPSAAVRLGAWWAAASAFLGLAGGGAVYTVLVPGWAAAANMGAAALQAGSGVVVV